MPNLDDLYAVSVDGGGVLHGDCAETKWGEDLPANVTPVYYGDTWRNEVAGMCTECGRFVDPEES